MNFSAKPVERNGWSNGGYWDVVLAVARSEVEGPVVLRNWVPRVARSIRIWGLVYALIFVNLLLYLITD